MTYVILFLPRYSYADATGAGKDVYEFVSSEDGFIHSIHLVLKYIQFHRWELFLCRLKKLESSRKQKGQKEYQLQTLS